MSNLAKMIPTFYPSAFHAGIVRIDSPSIYNLPVYEYDRRFFEDHKRRKMYMRPIWPGEFGTKQMYSPRPVQIHVWVKQLAVGVHEVMPVFVSKSNINLDHTTDGEVLDLVIEMQRMDGLERIVWIEFAEQWQAYVKASDASREAIQ
jgi:hypothetical protein